MIALQVSRQYWSVAQDIARTLPGVKLTRVNRPLGANPPGLPFAPCFVGTGSRTKRISNEQVVKGLTIEEALTVAGSTPYSATLINRALRDSGRMVVRRTSAGNTEVLNSARGQWSFDPAFVLGTATGTFDISTNNAFALDIDGGSYTMTLRRAAVAVTGSTISGTTSQALTVGAGHRVRVGDRGTVSDMDAAHNNTLVVTAVGATTVTLTGTGLTNGTSGDTTGTFTLATQVTEHQIDAAYAIVDDTAATRAEIAAAINVGLVAALGSDYVAAATDETTGVMIASQSSGLDSDVRIYSALAQDAAAVLFGAASIDAATVITIADAVYEEDVTATYEADYVALVDSTDDLAETPTSVRGLGSFAGGNNYRNGTDYTLSGSAVTWTSSAAVLTGTAATPADINPEDSFQLSIDRNAAFEVDLIDRAFQPIGYATISTPDTAAHTASALNINAVAALMLGPRYRAVATTPTVNGDVVLRITSVQTGEDAHVAVAATTSAQSTALLELFGIESDLGEASGAGRVPAQGSVVYATYNYARPSREYNQAYVWTDYAEALAALGGISSTVPGYNPLAIGNEIAQRIGASTIVTIQIDDATSPGNPTMPEIQDALEASRVQAEGTEVVLLSTAGTRLDGQTALIGSMEMAMDPEINLPTRVYGGAASSTEIGSRDTEGTLLFTPARTFQVEADSQGRGRMYFAVGPRRAQEGAPVQMDVRLDNGNSARLELDHTYVAALAAAQRSTLPSASSTLTRRRVNGVFVVPPKAECWNVGEIRRLYAGGCLILQSNGGALSWVEGVTTEKAGAAEVSWEVDSGTCQDDVLRQKVQVAMDAGLTGIVPTSLEGFLTDVRYLLKSTIESLIGAGEAGQYVEEDGNLTSRQLDINKDIWVKFSRTDPRVVYFFYSANRRYPVTKMIGTYSPDVNLLAALVAQA